MSVIRDIIFNVRERILSSDLNNLQAIGVVTTQAAARVQSRSGIETSIVPGPVTRENLGQVAGLVATITGVADTLDLTPGNLTTYSPSYPAPIVGQPFTAWRMYVGLDAGVTTTLATPIPGGADTWYALEARVGDAVTTASRDIRSTITNLFAPQVVNKFRNTTLETQWVAGTPGTGKYPSFTGGEWVPIAFVYLASGGGVIADWQVIDVRPLPSDLQGLASMAAVNRQGRFDWRVTGNNTIELTTVEPAVCQGLPLEYGAFNLGAFADLDLTTVADAAMAAGMWHLYIAPVKGRAPRPDRYGRGRLVLSQGSDPTLTPFAGLSAIGAERVWSNSVAIVDPQAGPTVMIGEGIYIGSFQRDGTNSFFEKAYCVNRHVRVDGIGGGYGLKFYSNGGNTTPTFQIPNVARLIEMGAECSSDAVGPATATLHWLQYATAGAGRVSATVAGPTITGEFELTYDAVYDTTDPLFTTAIVKDAAGATPGTWAISVWPTGYLW